MDAASTRREFMVKAGVAGVVLAGAAAVTAQAETQNKKKCAHRRTAGRYRPPRPGRRASEWFRALGPGLGHRELSLVAGALLDRQGEHDQSAEQQIDTRLHLGQLAEVALAEL